MKRAKDLNEMKWFLRKRGLWLIVAELLLINFAIWFDVQFRLLILMVICAIGFGMIVLSFLLKASPRRIGIAALAIIFLHNLLQFVPFPANRVAAFFTNLFFIPGFIWNSPHLQILVSYPLIPWLGVMMAGFALGRLFEKPAAERHKKLLQVGIAAIVLSLLLRFINLYGDPAIWQHQPTAMFTVLSFLNLSKSPPSLQFILLFAGIALVLLRFADALPAFIKNILSTYGKVPLFYYIVHFYLIRLFTIGMVYVQGFSWKDLLFGPFLYGRPAAGSGFGLGGVALAWIAIVILMYPLCKWYGKYKEDHPEKKWLRYI